MEHLSSCIQQGDCKQLITVCEGLELDEAISPKCIAPPEVYACLLCAYLSQSELENARYLWKRIPGNVKANNPLLGQVWNIGKCLWNRDFKGVYENTDGTAWPALLKPLIEILKEKIRRRVFRLLSESFSHISVNDAAVYMGLGGEETVLFATRSGWGYDANNGMLTPKSEPTVCHEDTDFSFLQNLTEFIVHLER
eukprot:Nk52_evm37s1671 gene=Nk52_evmTU37s1671